MHLWPGRVITTVIAPANFPLSATMQRMDTSYPISHTEASAHGSGPEAIDHQILNSSTACRPVPQGVQHLEEQKPLLIHPLHRQCAGGQQRLL